MLTVSIIIPVHNAKTTIKKALESLFSQSYQFDELVIVNDASNDGSDMLINDFLKVAENTYNKKPKIIFTSHHESSGLAASYNDGIKKSSGDLVVTMHADIIIKADGLKKLFSPFLPPSDSKIVASTHFVDHPLNIWNKYNFWQKCFFARQAGKKQSGIDGKFDCFRRDVLEKVGFFDEINYRVAGEDGDLVARIRKFGKIVQTEAEIIHLHKIDENFSWKDIILKQKQYSEAQGVLLRKGRMMSLKSVIKSFFREILIIGLFVPHINFLFFLLIVFYSFWYTEKVFFAEYKDWRIFILPFFNIFLLPISLVYTFRGIIYGKQRA
jgi:glycosyltransferase involved in cell wall biosynthesis